MSKLNITSQKVYRKTPSRASLRTAPQNRCTAVRRSKTPKRKTSLPLKRIIKKAGLAAVVLFLFLGGFYLWKISFLQKTKETVANFVSSQVQTKGFIVRDLIVEGRERTDRAEVLKAIQAKKGDPIVGLDLDKIRKNLLELPWIRAVAVKRQLPDALHIKISEHKPVALYQKNGRFSYITALGEHINRPTREMEKNLPVVTGEEAFRHFPALLLKVEAFPELKNKLSGAVFIGNRRWDLILDQRLRVQLPEEGIEDALKRLLTLMKEQSIEDREVIAIDLRYADRMYLRLSPEAAKLNESLNKVKLKKK